MNYNSDLQQPTQTVGTENRSSLRYKVDILDETVVDLSPLDLWDQILRSMSSGSEWVVAIVGDLVRDRFEAKSLPL